MAWGLFRDMLTWETCRRGGGKYSLLILKDFFSPYLFIAKVSSLCLVEPSPAEAEAGKTHQLFLAG